MRSNGSLPLCALGYLVMQDRPKPPGENAFDAYDSGGGIIVARTSDQVLPRYVVEYEYPLLQAVQGRLPARPNFGLGALMPQPPPFPVAGSAGLNPYVGGGAANGTIPPPKPKRARKKSESWNFGLSSLTLPSLISTVCMHRKDALNPAKFHVSSNTRRLQISSFFLLKLLPTFNSHVSCISVV